MADEAAVVPSCRHAAGAAVTDRAARRCCPMSNGWQSRCPAAACEMNGGAVPARPESCRSIAASHRLQLRRHGQQVQRPWAAGARPFSPQLPRHMLQALHQRTSLQGQSVE